MFVHPEIESLRVKLWLLRFKSWWVSKKRTHFFDQISLRRPETVATSPISTIWKKMKCKWKGWLVRLFHFSTCIASFVSLAARTEWTPNTPLKSKCSIQHTTKHHRQRRRRTTTQHTTKYGKTRRKPREWENGCCERKKKTSRLSVRYPNLVIIWTDWNIILVGSFNH